MAIIDQAHCEEKRLGREFEFSYNTLIVIYPRVAQILK